jgi:hypothetical protein
MHRLPAQCLQDDHVETSLEQIDGLWTHDALSRRMTKAVCSLGQSKARKSWNCERCIPNGGAISSFDLARRQRFRSPIGCGCRRNRSDGWNCSSANYTNNANKREPEQRKSADKNNRDTTGQQRVSTIRHTIREDKEEHNNIKMAASYLKKPRLSNPSCIRAKFAFIRVNSR